MVQRDYLAMYDGWVRDLQNLREMTREEVFEQHRTSIISLENKIGNLRKKLEQLGEKFDD